MSTFTSLVGALWYLRVNTLVGRIRSRLRRLKEPKYLVGAVVGAAYFYLVFFRRAHPPRFSGPVDGRAPVDGLPPEVLAAFGEFAALILLVVLVVNWLLPRQATLAFTESEIAFLFPAPVSRRMLVHYRVLGAQLGILFTALIFTVVSARARGSGGHAVYHFVGWWLVLALVNLHFTATSFVYSRLLNRSLTTLRSRVLTLTAGALVVIAIVAWIATSVRLPVRADIENAASLASYVTQTLHAGPLPWLLALPKLALAPYFATEPLAFARALVPALLLLAVHYFWVIHTEVSFEEASIARAEKRAARVRATRQGDWRGTTQAIKARAPAFALASAGRPEIAFLWKNLLATSALFRPKPWLAAVATLCIASAWLARQPVALPVGMVATTLASMIFAMTLLLGPQLMRQDLRTDLANADILKTYPLRGWQIVLGEILTPVLVLVGVAWFALLTIQLLAPAAALAKIPTALRGGAVPGIALLVPPFLAIQLLMPNAAAVLFPAWVQAVRDQTERGIEVMGQRLIFVASQLLVTTLVVLPALVVGGVLFFVGNLVAGPAVGLGLAVLAALALLCAVAWVGIRWLGSRFEALDISSELRP